MNASNHPVALAAYYLAPPKPSPTATSLSAQFHYAMSSWTPGGLAVLAGILGAFIGLMLLVRRAGGSRQQ